MSRRGWVFFGLLGVLWGIPYLLIRVAVRGFAPPDLVFFRTAAAGLLLLPLVVRREVRAAVVARWRAVVIFTVVEMALPWFFLARAEQHLASSLTGLLIAAVPLISIAIARLAGDREQLGFRRLAGLGIGLVGVAVIVGVNVGGPNVAALAEVAIVAIGYSLGPFVVARYLSMVPAIGVVGASLVLCGAGYAPWALTHLPSKVTGEEILAMAGLVVFCTVAAFLLFFALIAEIGAARATVVTYINPAVAVLLGVTLLGEHFTSAIAIGFPLVIGGSYLGTSAPSSSPRLDGHEPELSEPAGPVPTSEGVT